MKVEFSLRIKIHLNRVIAQHDLGQAMENPLQLVPLPVEYDKFGHSLLAHFGLFI
jgi:hypothetical protein